MNSEAEITKGVNADREGKKDNRLKTRASKIKIYILYFHIFNALYYFVYIKFLSLYLG